jgi:diguanylate cyclase (GGDEF)-like protein/PAS domain S-box-containing protein
MRRIISALAVWLACAMTAFAATDEPVAESTEATTTALNLAAPEALLDLGPSLSARDVNDPSSPEDAWFTVPVQNRSSTPVIRVLVAADRPESALAVRPPRTRPALIETASSNPDIVVERSPGYGEHTYRLVIPPNNAGTLALHFQGVRQAPSLLAWTEAALVSHNQQYAILTGLVCGLLIAATAFAAGAAILSKRAFPRWAALFLAAVVVGELSRTGFLDASWLTTFAGPYALSAFALSVGLACGIWLVDYVARFESFSPAMGLLRDWIAIAILLIGVAAFVGIPYAGVTVRALSVVGSAAAAFYLAHCGHLGISGARRLAPAATIFALVTAAAMLNAFGFFGGNLVTPGAIGGFSAAGALLVALATAIPMDQVVETVPEPAKVERPPEKKTPPPMPAAPVAPAAPVSPAQGLVREQAALNASHQGVFDLDLHTGLVSLSAEAAELLGLPSGAVELTRETWGARILPDDRETFAIAMESYRHHPGVAFRIEFRVRGPGGRIVWVELRATMTGQSTEAERCLGLLADVTARKSAAPQEAAPGPTDALTGLGTRAALISFLDAAPEGLKRWVLALFDIEPFKAINDSLGKSGGDALLVAMVERIEAGLASLPGSNRAKPFRVGGGMFAVTEMDVADAISFGRRIFDMMSAPFFINGREIYIQASVGVAVGSKADRGRDLLFNAERALGEARREGGSRVALYTGALAKPRAPDPVALDTDLRRALERDEIEVHYQPIIRLKDGAIAGFEALLRWRHPQTGMIQPDEFVAHAEQSDLIVNLGRQALRQAAKDLSRWQQFFPSRPPLYVSVNVTWRQIADEGFARELGAILKRAGLAKDSLRLEVTESAVMAGADGAEAGLQRLKMMGASLAIDDFGTGNSSLSQLARLPFDTIKIDRSFMTSVRQDAAGPKVLASILSLAHELKLAVIAEGIETDEDASLLRAMGCEQGQGFLFGAPMPAAQIFGFIAACRGQKA